VFRVTGGPQTTILYKADSLSAGLGVVSQPAGGGTYNSQGGYFVFLSGLPYLWNHDDLRANIETIMARYMPENLDVSAGLHLVGAVPNPFAGSAVLRFYLPEPGLARLAIYDVMGRRLRMVRDGLSPAGWNDEPWDGRDDAAERWPPASISRDWRREGKRPSGRLSAAGRVLPDTSARRPSRRTPQLQTLIPSRPSAHE